MTDLISGCLIEFLKEERTIQVLRQYHVKNVFIQLCNKYRQHFLWDLISIVNQF